MNDYLKPSKDVLEAFDKYLETAGKEYLKALDNFFEQKEKEPIIQLSGVVEIIIGLIYEGIYNKGHATLIEMTDSLIKSGDLPGEIGSAVHYIRVLANKVRHGALRSEVTLFDTESCLRLCYRVIVWHLQENTKGPLLVKVVFFTEALNAQMSYPERVRLISNLINQSDVTRKVISSLVQIGPASVDELTTRLNLSRMVIIQSLTRLLENEIVCFKESGSDTLCVNPATYNIEHIIEGIISDV